MRKGILNKIITLILFSVIGLNIVYTPSYVSSATITSSYSIPPRIRFQIGTIGFYFNFKDRTVVHSDSYLMNWDWYVFTPEVSERYIDGFYIQTHTGDIILKVGYNGTAFRCEDLFIPSEFLFNIDDYFSKEKQTIGLYWRIDYTRGVFGDFRDGFIRITWIPRDYSLSPIEIPLYVYISLGIVGTLGITVFLIQKLYSCEEPNNIRKKHCRKYYRKFIKEMKKEQQKEIYESEKSKITKILFESDT